MTCSFCKGESNGVKFNGKKCCIICKAQLIIGGSLDSDDDLSLTEWGALHQKQFLSGEENTRLKTDAQQSNEDQFKYRKFN